MWVVFAMAEGETYLGYPFPRVSATFVMLTVWAMFIVGIQEATMNFYRREPPPLRYTATGGFIGAAVIALVAVTLHWVWSN